MADRGTVAGAMPRHRDEKLLRRIGARLKVHRAASGMTQQQLAEAIGLTPQNLSRAEGGLGGMSLGMLQRVADALGIRLGDLVDAESPPAADEREMELLRLWRALPDDEREVALRMLRGAATR